MTDKKIIPLIPLVLIFCCFHCSNAADTIDETLNNSLPSPDKAYIASTELQKKNLRDHIYQTTKPTKTIDALNDAQQSFFQKINAFENLHATFTQRLNNPNQDLMQKSQGELWITKPSFFKWVVSSPNQQTLVSDGKKLWIYDKELAQVTVQAVPDNITQAPYLLLLTGKPETLAQLFSIAQLNNNHYRLTPKDKEQSLMKYIDIVFKGKLLSKLVIQTDMGQSTDISFSKQSIAEIPLDTYQLGQLPDVAILDSTA